MIRVQRSLVDPLRDFIARTCGGRRAVYGLLERATHDPEAQRIYQVWRSLAHNDQQMNFQTIDFDQIFDAAQIHARDFIAVLARIGWDFGLDLSRAIFNMRVPEMMHASMEKATQIDGTEERRMHFQAMGYLPTSRGIQIGIKNTNVVEREPEPGEAPPHMRTARRVVRALPPRTDV